MYFLLLIFCWGFNFMFCDTLLGVDYCAEDAPFFLFVFSQKGTPSKSYLFYDTCISCFMKGIARGQYMYIYRWNWWHSLAPSQPRLRKGNIFFYLTRILTKLKWQKKQEICSILDKYLPYRIFTNFFNLIFYLQKSVYYQNSYPSVPLTSNAALYCI